MTNVFEQPEAFRRGWAGGLYGLSAEGLQHVDNILRHGVEDDEDGRCFLAGFRAGRAARQSRVMDHRETAEAMVGVAA